MADKYILNERFFGAKTRVSKSIADEIASLYGPNAVMKRKTSYSVEIPLFTKQQYEIDHENILNVLAQSKTMISPRIFIPREHAINTRKFVFDYVEHKVRVAGDRAKDIASRELQFADKALWGEPFTVKKLTLPYTKISPLLYAGKSGMSLVRENHNVNDAVVALAGFQTDAGKIITLDKNINAHLEAGDVKAIYPYFEVYAPVAGKFSSAEKDIVKTNLHVIAHSYASNIAKAEAEKAKQALNTLVAEKSLFRFGINLHEWNALKRQALTEASYDHASFLHLQLSRVTAVARASKWKKYATSNLIERLKSYTPKTGTLAFDIETLSTGNVLQVGLSKAGAQTSMILKDTYRRAELLAPPPIIAPGYVNVLTQAAAGKGAYTKQDISELFKGIYSNVKTGNTKLLGYNVLGFDFEQLQHAGMLGKEEASFLKSNVVDVYNLLQKYQAVVETVYNTSLPNLRLTTVATKLGVANAREIALKAHSADYDSWLTEQVYKKIAFTEAMDNAFSVGKAPSFFLPESLQKFERTYLEAYKALEKMDASVMSYKKLDQILRSKGEKFLGTRGTLTGFERGYTDIQGGRLSLRFRQQEGTLEITGKTLGPIVEIELDAKRSLFGFAKNLSRHAQQQLQESLENGETTFASQMLTDSLLRKGTKLAVKSEQNVSKYFSTVSNVLYNSEADADLLTLHMRLPKIIENQPLSELPEFEKFTKYLNDLPDAIDTGLLLSEKTSSILSAEEISKLTKWFDIPDEITPAETSEIFRIVSKATDKMQKMGNLTPAELKAIDAINFFKKSAEIGSQLSKNITFPTVDRIIKHMDEHDVTVKRDAITKTKTGETVSEMFSDIFAEIKNNNVEDLAYNVYGHVKEIVGYEKAFDTNVTTKALLETYSQWQNRKKAGDTLATSADVLATHLKRMKAMEIEEEKITETTIDLNQAKWIGAYKTSLDEISPADFTDFRNVKIRRNNFLESMYQSVRANATIKHAGDQYDIPTILTQDIVDVELKYSSPTVLGGLKGETIAEIKDAFIDFTRKYSGNVNIKDLQQLYQEYLRNVRGFTIANSMLEMKYKAPNEISDMYKPGSYALRKVINLAEKYTSSNVSYKIEDFKGYTQAVIENEIHNMFEKSSKRGTNTFAEFIKELNSSPVFNVFDDKLSLSDKLAFAMRYVHSSHYTEDAFGHIEESGMLESIFNEDNFANFDIMTNDTKTSIMNQTTDESKVREHVVDEAQTYKTSNERMKEINSNISDLFEQHSKNYETVYNKFRKSLKKMTTEEKLNAISTATMHYSEMPAKVSEKYIKRLHKYNLYILSNQNANLENLRMAAVEAINGGDISLNAKNVEANLERAISEINVALLVLQRHKASDEQVRYYTDSLKQHIDALERKVVTVEKQLKDKITALEHESYEWKKAFKDVNNIDSPKNIISAFRYNDIHGYDKAIGKLSSLLEMVRNKYEPKLESYKTLSNAELYLVSNSAASSKTKSKIADNSLFSKMNSLSKGKSVQFDQDELLILKALSTDNLKLKINKKIYTIGEPVIVKVNDETKTILPLVHNGKAVFVGKSGKIAEFANVSPEELPFISVQLQKQKYEVTSEGSLSEMMPQNIKEALMQVYEYRRENLQKQQQGLIETAQAFEEKVESVQQIMDKYKLKAKEFAKAKSTKETQEVLKKYSDLDAETKTFIDNMLEHNKELFAQGKQYDDEMSIIAEDIQRIAKKGKDDELTKVLGIKWQFQKAAKMLKHQVEYKQTIIKELTNQEPTPEDIAQAIKKIAYKQNAKTAKYTEDGVNYYNETAEKLISKTSLKNSIEGVQHAAKKLMKDERFWKALGIISAISAGLYALSYTATKGTSKQDIHKALKTQVQDDTRYHPQLMKDFSFVMTPYGVNIDYYADSNNQVNYPTSYINALDLSRTSLRR